MLVMSLQSEPIKALQNGVPQTIRQELSSYKIEDDKDLKAFQEDLIKGADIVFSCTQNNATYVMLRKIIPLKVQL
jgi:ornithine cyclodeaminase/alanine dehydrogenase-like protein (mu-crystallin family)